MNDDRHAEAGATNLQRVAVAEFIQELETSAALEDAGYGLHLEVHCVGSDVTIAVDWQLLMSAVANLLQNAFKYTRPRGHIELKVRTTDDQVSLMCATNAAAFRQEKQRNCFVLSNSQRACAFDQVSIREDRAAWAD